MGALRGGGARAAFLACVRPSRRASAPTTARRRFGDARPPRPRGGTAAARSREQDVPARRHVRGGGSARLRRRPGNDRNYTPSDAEAKSAKRSLLCVRLRRAAPRRRSTSAPPSGRATAERAQPLPTRSAADTVTSFRPRSARKFAPARRPESPTAHPSPSARFQGGDTKSHVNGRPRRAARMPAAAAATPGRSSGAPSSIDATASKRPSRRRSSAAPSQAAVAASSLGCSASTAAPKLHGRPARRRPPRSFAAGGRPRPSGRATRVLADDGRRRRLLRRVRRRRPRREGRVDRGPRGPAVPPQAPLLQPVARGHEVPAQLPPERVRHAPAQVLGVVRRVAEVVRARVAGERRAEPRRVRPDPSDVLQERAQRLVPGRVDARPHDAQVQRLRDDREVLGLLLGVDRPPERRQGPVAPQLPQARPQKHAQLPPAVPGLGVVPLRHDGLWRRRRRRRRAGASAAGGGGAAAPRAPRGTRPSRPGDPPSRTRPAPPATRAARPPAPRPRATPAAARPRRPRSRRRRAAGPGVVR